MQVSTIAPAPQALPAPLATMAHRPFASVLSGLIGAQLSRPAVAPAASAPAGALPAGIPSDAVTVGPNGPTTIGAFRFWHRVLPVGADS